MRVCFPQRLQLFQLTVICILDLGQTLLVLANEKVHFKNHWKMCLTLAGYSMLKWKNLKLLIIEKEGVERITVR